VEKIRHQRASNNKFSFIVVPQKGHERLVFNISKLGVDQILTANLPVALIVFNMLN
jgi:hypothetical protein